MEKFFTGLRNRFTTNIRAQFYELGQQQQNGYRYPAINVTDWRNGNAVGAWFSRGHANDYGKSILEGKRELIAYIVKQQGQCPDTPFVLAGYSQGAQVIGETLPSLPESVHDKILFAALFGDPKLDLPEGRGFNPPACRGEQLSAWRRQVDNCHTDDGALGARTPYIPKSMQDRTGLWCLDRDFVCGSSKIMFINDGHEKYRNDNGAIDQAVLEIARRLSPALPDISEIDIKPHGGVQNTVGPLVILLIDTSTNIDEDYFANYVKPRASAFINHTVNNLNGAVSIRTFSGCRGSVKMHAYTTAAIPLATLDSLALQQPLCDLSQDLIDGIESISHINWHWRDDAKKDSCFIHNNPSAYQ